MQENIPLTLNKVLELQNKIENNLATFNDYAQLDFLLSAINMGGYILQTIKDRGYYDYDNYIRERKKSDINKKDVFSESFVNGTIKESITLLKGYLNR